ncbi:PilZ domain-containing protein [Bosea sp. NBC_00550]|uniref:PilZ domain-containing protein n=1 Tax=Bosea sp. NBC_00550 TaxID=2969621 RepID=UPI003FA47A05
MLTPRQEATCRAVDMSPGGLSLETAVQVRPGERIVAYIDEIGRIEGLVARTTRTGFAMTINATGRKRDKLAAILTFQANREDLDIADIASGGKECP